MQPNADTVARYSTDPHPIPAAKWMGYNPWPVCSDCERPVYRSDEWRHFDAFLNGSSETP